MRLAKNDFSSVFGLVLQKMWFLVQFRFYKVNRGFVFFGSVRPTFVCRRRRHLSFTPLRYNARHDVVPYWIAPTNCQPKWLRTRSAETRHEEKYFDCWSYHVGRWIVNETTRKTVPKPPKSVFWKPNRGNWVFGFSILRTIRFLENWYPTFWSGSAHS